MANPQPPNRPSGTDMALVVNTLTTSVQFRDEIKAFLPPNADIKKFMQAAIVAVQRSAHILSYCDKQSVYNAIADAASRNLVPDGRQGALVPYRSKNGPPRCQFLVMPEGIIETAARVGTSVYAVSVYEGDEIELWNDLEGQHFTQRYNPWGDRGARVGAVAVAKLRNGQTYVEAMNMAELTRAKETTKSRNDHGEVVGPWVEWPERMEQKTVLHRLHKRVPGIPLEDDEEYAGPSNRVQLAQAASPPPDDPVVRSVTAALTAGPPSPKGRPRALQRVVDENGAVLAQDTGGEREPAAPEPTAAPATKSSPPPAEPF